MTDKYQADANDLEGIVSIASEFGFCAVKGVFSPEEMAAIEADMKSASEDSDGNIPDLLSCEKLRWVMLNDRIMSVAHALLGQELVYYGETAVNYEATAGKYTNNPYNELHFDARGMPDNLVDIWQPPSNSDHIFGAYRFGIYLRDYSLSSGGLKVAVKSHLGDPDPFERAELAEKRTIKGRSGSGNFTHLAPTFELFNVPTEPGDVVVWNLRTMHAAGALKLKDYPDAAMHPRLEGKLLKSAPHMFEPSASPRNAIFFDYGRPCEDVDLHIKHRSQLSSEKNFSEMRRLRFDTHDIADIARAYGIQLRFDRAIIPLATDLLGFTKPGDSDERSIQRGRERFLNMLSRHEEYSPHHVLYESSFLEQIGDLDESGKAIECAKVIVTRMSKQKTAAFKKLGYA